jgi:FSR family fosmidomycin resistance protein-like MFS transporter
LLPVFQDKFSLSKTLVGVLIFAISTSGSLFQVIYGYFGDKWGRRLFLVPGPAIAAIFMCFIGLSPSFLILLILLLMGGAGVSAFHPHAASAAGDMAGSKRGFGLSIFMTGGTIGFALGPLIAAALISSRFIGPTRMPLFSILGLATSILLYKYAIPEEKNRKVRNSVNVLEVIRPHVKILVFLCLIVILRATTSIVFANFLSLLMDQRGLSLVMGGSIISLFLFSTACGTLFGGYLCDRFNRKNLLIFSLLISAPFLFAMVYFSGILLFIVIILAGVMLGCSNPIPLTISQELIPKGASTTSSLMMGLSWGVAGLPAWFFGMLADQFGGNVAPSMSIAAFLPILGAVFALPLPRK